MVGTDRRQFFGTMQIGYKCKQEPCHRGVHPLVKNIVPVQTRARELSARKDTSGMGDEDGTQFQYLSVSMFQ